MKSHEIDLIFLLLLQRIPGMPDVFDREIIISEMCDFLNLGTLIPGTFYGIQDSYIKYFWVFNGFFSSEC